VKRIVILLLLSLLFASCSKKQKKEADSPNEKPATPVRVASVERATLAEFVSAPGKITAMAQAKVRAPFAGTLTELRVTDGDPVRGGEIVGSVVSRDSEAALSGAREMERQASTEGERRDAARAVALAEKNLVHAPLSVSAAGVVASHAASTGDRVAEGEEIVSIAEMRSLVLLADVAQPQLSKIRAGENVAIDIVGRPPLAATVHDVLPAGSTADLTAPVRIDFASPPGVLPVGLFATARITVAEHPDAVVVADAAVLRDDVTGASRMATLGADGKAHWIAVTPGISQNGRTEILAPALAIGQKVLIAGQVGLPEGAAVTTAP
jgi:membrane fusion protein (multidrug efflux system)